MNIEEYDKCEGFTPSPPSCLYCGEGRFYQDLCIRHTKQLLVKLGMVKTLFSGDPDIEAFITNSIRVQRIGKRLEDMDAAIRYMHHADCMTVEQVSHTLEVSRSYVQEVLE